MLGRHSASRLLGTAPCPAAHAAKPERPQKEANSLASQLTQVVCQDGLGSRFGNDPIALSRGRKPNQTVENTNGNPTVLGMGFADIEDSRLTFRIWYVQVSALHVQRIALACQDRFNGFKPDVIFDCGNP